MSTSSPRQPHTAAVITRVQLIEAPYLNEFVYWYVDVLGFSRVYAVNTEPWNEEAILRHLDAPMKEKMTLIPLPVHADQQNSVQKYMLSLVRKYVTQEEYILHVDSDELLLLPHGEDPDTKPLCSFLKAYPQSNRFVFHWLTIACHETYCGSMIDLWRTHPHLTGKRSPSYKMMARIEHITHMDHHSMFLGAKHRNGVDFTDPDVGSPRAAVLLHFITRSKTHTIWKTRHQRMRNTKSQKASPNDVRRFLLCETHPPPIAWYPPRILIHMHEVVYGIRENVLGDVKNRADRVPPCPYTYPEERQREDFVRLLCDIVGPERVEQAIHNLEKFMDTDIIYPFTTGCMAAYVQPGSLMQEKFKTR